MSKTKNQEALAASLATHALTAPPRWNANLVRKFNAVLEKVLEAGAQPGSARMEIIVAKAGLNLNPFLDWMNEAPFVIVRNQVRGLEPEETVAAQYKGRFIQCIKVLNYAVSKWFQLPKGQEIVTAAMELEMQALTGKEGV